MEAIILPLRNTPKTLKDKQLSSLSEIDILLVNGNLICTKLLLDDEPTTTIGSFLHSITPQHTTLKGKRAVCVAASPTHTSSMFCVPVQDNDTMTGSYSFENLLRWMEGVNSLPHSSTHKAVLRIKSWLEGLQLKSGALELLFSNFADDRFKWSILNPGFQDEQIIFGNKSSFSSSSSSSSSHQKGCQDEVEVWDRCDILHTNPLFGSNLSFKYKVDRLVTNRAWNLKTYSSTTNLTHHFNNFDLLSNNNNMNNNNTNNNKNRNNNNNNNSGDDSSFNNSNADSLKFEGPSFMSDSAGRRFKKPTYPLHQQVLLNSFDGVVGCLKGGYSALDQDGYFDTPLHLAAEKGHLELVNLMLGEGGVDINSTNYHGQNLLHVACANKQAALVDFLLKKGINVALKDKSSNTALKLCVERGADECGRLLKRFIQQPLGTIDMHLMDGSHRQLLLPHHADTTALQLHRLMMKELQLPSECVHLFAIWICSKNLQLQLTKDQKPIQQLNQWKSSIVIQMSDHPPEMEDPELYWRRDVLLSIRLEYMVSNHIAIGLLFTEAYHNFIKSFYLCHDQDSIRLGGCIMQLFFGNFRPSNDYFKQEGLLESLVPGHLVGRESRKSWGKKISTQYQVYSSSRASTVPRIHHLYFLNICRELTTYGCAFFIGFGKLKNKTSRIFVGINDVGCQIIETVPRRLSESFKYGEIDWRLNTSAERGREMVLWREKFKKNQFVIVSKQAGLMNSLMKRLSNLPRS